MSLQGEMNILRRETVLTVIHSLVFSLTGRVGRNQSPIMWPVRLWHTASWASSWGRFAIAWYISRY